MGTKWKCGSIFQDQLFHEHVLSCSSHFKTYLGKSLGPSRSLGSPNTDLKMSLRLTMPLRTNILYKHMDSPRCTGIFSDDSFIRNTTSHYVTQLFSRAFSKSKRGGKALVEWEGARWRTLHVARNLLRHHKYLLCRHVKTMQNLVSKMITV